MSLLKVLATVGGAVAVGTTAVLLAPVALPALGLAGVLGAAGTGTAISTLSGAALVSASTAAVTGTVAGTTAVIGGAAAAAGGTAGYLAGKKIEKKNS